MQPTTGGLFGNASAAAQPQQQNSGVFGSNSGGLFGSSNTSSQPAGTSAAPAVTSGLFGNISTATQPQTQALGGGLFGNKPSGSLFGGSTINTTNTTQPSLFGAPQQPQQAGASLFFQAQPQQQRTGLFGNSSTLNASALGASVSTQGQALGQSQLPRAPASTQPADPQAQHALLLQRIEAVANSWDSNSPACRFQHYFYNLVDTNQVSLYGRPPNATNDALWQRAVQENPDPSCLVPVIAFGFDDLQQRVQAQQLQSTQHQEKLKELQTRLNELSQRHTMSNVSRLSRASATQTKLTHRLLAFVQHLHMLIPTLRSSSIRQEEEEMRTKLGEIEEDVRRGRMGSKLNELWALLGSINAARRVNGGATGGLSGEWAVVDEDGLAQLTKVLSEQQAGLAHLTKILQKDMKDLDVILGRGQEGFGGEEEGENLFNSTSTLRASMLY